MSRPGRRVALGAEAAGSALLLAGGVTAPVMGGVHRLAQVFTNGIDRALRQPRVGGRATLALVDSDGGRP